MSKIRGKIIQIIPAPPDLWLSYGDRDPNTCRGIPNRFEKADCLALVEYPIEYPTEATGETERVIEVVKLDNEGMALPECLDCPWHGWTLYSARRTDDPERDIAATLAEREKLVKP